MLRLFVFLCSLSAFAGPTEWTFLFYESANNDLDPYMTENVEEMVRGMKNAHPDQRIRLVIQWGSMNQDTVKRIEITPEGMVVVQDLGALDMGSAKSLEDFTKWGMQNYPAEHYFLGLSSHGTGWLPRKRSFGPDEVSGNSISTEQLRDVLKKVPDWTTGKKITLGFDACLMGQCEFVSEFQNSVDYLVASAEEIPGRGWPYDTFFRRINSLSKAGSVSPETVAKLWPELYLKKYVKGEEEATLAALDMSQAGTLEKALKDFSRIYLAMSEQEKTKVFGAAYSAIRYDDDAYVDLVDFLNRVKKGSASIDVQSSIDAIIGQVRKVVLFEIHTKHFPNAGGLAIWMPRGTGQFYQHLDKYMNLTIGDRSHWGVFLTEFMEFQSRHPEMMCNVYLKDVNTLKRLRQQRKQLEGN